MLAGKLIEMIFQDYFSIDDLRGALLMLYLKKQTLTQVSCTHSCRLELLDDSKHLQHLFLCRLHIGSERQVVNYAVYASAKISVIVKTADDERADCYLMLSKIPIPQLFLEALGKAFLYRKSTVLRTFVLDVVIVRTQTICRDGIILLVLGQ